MTASTRTAPPPSREEFSDRLLKGSARKSYAPPVVDIDWDTPPSCPTSTSCRPPG